MCMQHLTWRPQYISDVVAEQQAGSSSVLSFSNLQFSFLDQQIFFFGDHRIFFLRFLKIFLSSAVKHTFY